jgi:ubiquinone/menaquinone biosynthesis C-methylase UbiE
MKTTYKLDAANEGKRLEEQSANSNYCLKDELGCVNVQINKNDQILDAGCGTGLLSRFLVDYFTQNTFTIDSIDITESLIKFAQIESEKNAQYKGRITYTNKNITDLSGEKKYNKIFSRFVFQHIPSREQQKLALAKLWDVLAPGGKMYLIDCYGFFSNLETTNDWLVEMIKQVENSIPIDMNIGPKLRGMLIDVGVPAELIQTTVLPFIYDTPEQREAEACLWRQRFQNANPLLLEALGELKAKRFVSEYLKEFLNRRTYIYAQKFILTVSKP